MKIIIQIQISRSEKYSGTGIFTSVTLITEVTLDLETIAATDITNKSVLKEFAETRNVITDTLEAASTESSANFIKRIFVPSSI